jgi:uncharacterized membrane protein
MHRLITLGLALYSFFLIKTNIPRLPARIPTHFDVAGEANAWGSPDILWFLFLIQVLVCGLMLAMPLVGRRFPGTVHLGTRNLSDFTPELQEQIMPLFTRMMEWMSVLLGLLFSSLLYEIIQTSASAHPHIPKWELGAFLGGTVVILIYYLSRINALAGDTLSGG